MKPTQSSTIAHTGSVFLVREIRSAVSSLIYCLLAATANAAAARRSNGALTAVLLQDAGGLRVLRPMAHFSLDSRLQLC
jgi:hypothetical protein